MTDEPKKKPAKDDPVATAILKMLADDAVLTFKEIALHIFEDRRRPKDRADGWRKYMNAVKQQVVHLARQSRVEIMRKGQVVDPRDFKGIVRVRLTKPQASKAATKSETIEPQD